ncbi:hypothetical protein L0F63_007375, partial [Massospora cicadina]
MDHGKKSECEISTPVKGFASAFGCYSTDNRNTYRCLSGGKELPARNCTAFQQLESKLAMRSSLYLLTKSESAFDQTSFHTYISKASAYTVATMYDPTLSDELVIRQDK